MKPNLALAIIQSDLYWESTDANLAMFEEKIWEIASADLIILPEMFTTGFSMEPAPISEPVNGKTLRWMKQMAAQSKAVIMGSYIVKSHPDYFNRCYLVFPDGRSHFYDKRHLFSLAGEHKNFTAGKEKQVVDICGWKVCPQICYDLRFPVWSRSMSETDLYEYDLLVYVANWPIPRINAWDTLLAARAIENVSYVVGANRLGVDGSGAEYNGHSAIYNYKGEPLAFADSEIIIEYTINRDELDAFRNRFPFQSDADSFKLDR